MQLSLWHKPPDLTNLIKQLRQGKCTIVNGTLLALVPTATAGAQRAGVRESEREWECCVVAFFCAFRSLQHHTEFAHYLRACVDSTKNWASIEGKAYSLRDVCLFKPEPPFEVLQARAQAVHGMLVLWWTQAKQKKIPKHLEETLREVVNRLIRDPTFHPKATEDARSLFPELEEEHDATREGQEETEEEETGSKKKRKTSNTTTKRKQAKKISSDTQPRRSNPKRGKRAQPTTDTADSELDLDLALASGSERVEVVVEEGGEHKQGQADVVAAQATEKVKDDDDEDDDDEAPLIKADSPHKPAARGGGVGAISNKEQSSRADTSEVKTPTIKSGQVEDKDAMEDEANSSDDEEEEEEEEIAAGKVPSSVPATAIVSTSSSFSASKPAVVTTTTTTPSVAATTLATGEVVVVLPLAPLGTMHDKPQPSPVAPTTSEPPKASPRPSEKAPGNDRAEVAEDEDDDEGDEGDGDEGDDEGDDYDDDDEEAAAQRDRLHPGYMAQEQEPTARRRPPPPPVPPASLLQPKPPSPITTNHLLGAGAAVSPWNRETQPAPAAFAGAEAQVAAVQPASATLAEAEQQVSSSDEEEEGGDEQVVA